VTFQIKAKIYMMCKLGNFELQFSKDEGNVTDDKVPYSYGFFHFVFAMGSMYFAMLFVGWNLHQTMHRWECC
jgi:hypothetical protein